MSYRTELLERCKIIKFFKYEIQMQLNTDLLKFLCAHLLIYLRRSLEVNKKKVFLNI